MSYLTEDHADGYVSVICNRCKYCAGAYRSLGTAKTLLRTVEGWHITDQVAICKVCIGRALRRKRPDKVVLEVFAWLSCRDGSVTLGAKHSSALAAELAQEFRDQYGKEAE